MHFFRRRTALALSAVVIHSLAFTCAAAEAYPSKQIRIVSILPPGGSVDGLARLISDPLGQRLGLPVIVDNKPGAGGNLAAGLVARAPGDGSTILITANNHTINPVLFKNAGYQVSDFKPVIGVMSGPSVIVVAADSPYKNLQDLLAAARARPGSITYGSAGNGLPSHVAGELLKRAAGVDMIHVPYRGSGPSLTDALGGQIPVVISSLVAAAPHVKAGRLRAIAVTTEKRWPSMPDVPAVSEVVPGFKHDIWIGLFVPKSTPTEVVQQLNREIAAIVQTPVVAEKIADLGGTTAGLTGLDEFTRFIERDRVASARQVTDLNLRAD